MSRSAQASVRNRQCLARAFFTRRRRFSSSTLCDAGALPRCGTFSRRRLCNAGALPGRSTLARTLFSVRLRVCTKILPGRFAKVDVVIFRGLFDVRKGKRAGAVGNVGDLIESRNGISHVSRISQRFFSLFGKSKNAVRKIALHRQAPVLFMRMPGRSHMEIVPGIRQKRSVENGAPKGQTRVRYEPPLR